MTIRALNPELVLALEEQYSAEEVVQGKYSHAITALLLWSTLLEDDPKLMSRLERYTIMVDKSAKKLVKMSFEPQAYWWGGHDFRSQMLYHITHGIYRRIYSGWLCLDSRDTDLLHRYCVYRAYVYISSS